MKPELVTLVSQCSPEFHPAQRHESNTESSQRPEGWDKGQQGDNFEQFLLYKSQEELAEKPNLGGANRARKKKSIPSSSRRPKAPEIRATQETIEKEIDISDGK